ncbi:hypothetical protein HYFRA_00013050 [Hymenoscyphus fraxineus]|uniref:Uncharacterized protein n=1 Tax=Hymenoscyphus fraxineus TaxID=746836 RepID=A0A9N9L7T5_9HELO|nr:hypothetical protein HYFRA_00013050 [Hymenoscyphus fraxineus]
MSDTLRKGLGDQAAEKVTPQSQKSNTQVAGEYISGAADKVTGAVQPNDTKSTTQKLGDSTRSGADKGQNEGSSYLSSAKDGLTNAANTISGKTSDATK